MRQNNYSDLQLAEQLQLLGDLSNPDPALCNAIELEVIDLLRQGRFKAIAEAVQAHQQAFGLCEPEKKLPRLSGFTDVTAEHPRLKYLTWHFTGINPIRRLIEQGDYAVVKPLSRHFTGFTPSGLVVGSYPPNYGQDMDRVQAGSRYSGIAAEGLENMLFKITAKKPFNDVLKLYGKGDLWIEGRALREIVRNEQAPLNTFHIWAEEFTSAKDELLLTTDILQKIAMPLYEGQNIDNVVSMFIKEQLADPFTSSRVKFWRDTLLADEAPTLAIMNTLIYTLVESKPGGFEKFMNEAFLNTQVAISRVSEALTTGSQHKVMHAMLIGQAQVGTDWTVKELYRDLADTKVDRKALLEGLDIRKVKSIDKYYGWPECLPYLGNKELGQRFGEDLGL